MDIYVVSIAGVCTHLPLRCSLDSRKCRDDYVYVSCKLCGAACAARSQTGISGRWHVTKASLTALCTHSIVPALPSPSVSAAPVSPLPSVSVPTATCCICDDDFQRPVMFECPNPSAHLLCPECFELDVSSQFGQDISAFINRNCTITCTFCSCEAGNRKT